MVRPRFRPEIDAPVSRRLLAIPMRYPARRTPVAAGPGARRFLAPSASLLMLFSLFRYWLSKRHTHYMKCL